MHMYVLAAATFALTAALIAHSKGRSAFGWFLSGFVIGPFALIVAALPPLAENGGYMNCPYCREVVRADVRVCCHCKSDIVRRIRDPGGAPPQLPQQASVTIHDGPDPGAP